MEKETEKAVEIPEAEAPPLEAMVEGEADAGNPDTRAQIADPDSENGENSGKIAEKSKSKKSRAEGKNWAEVAKGKRGRPRKNPLTPEEMAEKTAEEEAKKTAKMEAARQKAIEGMRRAKAAGYVQVAELGFLFVGRRFGVPEKDMRFSRDESQALENAIVPLIPETDESDPWGNLALVGMAVAAPRVAILAEARAEQQKAEQQAAQNAENAEAPWANAAA